MRSRADSAGIDDDRSATERLGIRPGATIGWYDVARAVLVRDSYICHRCQQTAATCRRTRRHGPWQDPASWSAVCTDCQLVTPAPEHQPRRRGKRPTRRTVAHIGDLPMLRSDGAD